MATIADLVIKVSADSSPAEKGIASFGSKVGGGFKKALLPATVALGALGVAGKVAFDNLRDGAKNAAQTEAVLKSTGGAANVTAKHVDQLSMSLRRKAGVDDDVVHAGANMLLTFTNVRNEVGKGNAIFDRATATMLDMSVALGQDTKSSAIQLGKALNDPIRGVTALQRVGVTFTQAQKKQIKTMVESGNVMGAQKLILRELNKEFGGSATHIDPMQKSMANLKLDMVDFASGLLTSLMPALQGLIGILGRATSFLTEHQTAAKLVVGVIAALAIGVLLVNAAMAVYAAGAVVVSAATGAWTAAQWLLNAALTANPIGIVIVALAALVAAIVIAYTHSEKFRQVVTTAWNAIKSVTLAVFNAIVAFFRAYWPILLAVFTGGLSLIVGAIVTHWGTVKSITSGAWEGIKTVVTTAVNAIKTSVETVFNALGGIVKGAVAAVRAGANGIVSAFNGIVSILRTIISVASSAVSMIERVVSAAGKVASIPGKIGGALSHIPHPGIPFHANGVRNSPGGLAVVGERGPELVDLPRGSSVFSNSKSRGMMGGGGNDIGDVYLDGTKVGKHVRRSFNKTKRRTGGLQFEAG